VSCLFRNHRFAGASAALSRSARPWLAKLRPAGPASAAIALAICTCAQQSNLIEVASIKPSSNTVAESNMDSSHGRLTATNITVRELIRFAYALRDEQIAQAPRWIDSERLDIDVKTASADSGNLDDERALVRELLADRFRLTTHRDSKEMAIYALVVDKNGPKLKAHSDAVEKIRGGCGRLVGRRVTADGIASMLSRQLQREVSNQTGLTGEYDFQLGFTPDSGPCRATADDANCSAVDAPSIFTAVEQQLGLKLKPSKGPVELLVIDRVQQPSQN